MCVCVCVCESVCVCSFYIWKDSTTLHIHITLSTDRKIFQTIHGVLRRSDYQRRSWNILTHHSDEDVSLSQSVMSFFSCCPTIYLVLSAIPVVTEPRRFERLFMWYLQCLTIYISHMLFMLVTWYLCKATTVYKEYLWSASVIYIYYLNRAGHIYSDNSCRASIIFAQSIYVVLL